jgi:hypothetical protein
VGVGVPTGIPKSNPCGPGCIASGLSKLLYEVLALFLPFLKSVHGLIQLVYHLPQLCESRFSTTVSSEPFTIFQTVPRPHVGGHRHSRGGEAGKGEYDREKGVQRQQRHY